jgi:MoaA/NifB/PqqE/SkfB family radical SAM enzyme
MQDLRRSFRNGDKPQSCKQCWTEEAAGKISKRLVHTTKFSKELETIEWDKDVVSVPWFIDLKLGNICNLKCRICGSYASSKWAAEENSMSKKVSTHLRDGSWPRGNSQFWHDLHQILPHVKYFEISGGEPFLIQEHFDLLKFAADHGYAKDISIHYNTNGTVYPEDAAEIWKAFKLVEIAFSIDNTGARFEYERYGANWDEVNANIDRFRTLRSLHSNITLQLCLTVSVFNVLYLDATLNWAATKEFNTNYLNLLFNPIETSVTSLPQPIKDVVEARLAQKAFSEGDSVDVMNLIKVMQNGSPQDLSLLLAKIEASDKFRKQKLSDSHPELSELLYGK